jgi:hypothetical protein
MCIFEIYKIKEIYAWRHAINKNSDRKNKINKSFVYGAILFVAAFAIISFEAGIKLAILIFASLVPMVVLSELLSRSLFAKGLKKI